jgi:hypothetical protein
LKEFQLIENAYAKLEKIVLAPQRWFNHAEHNTKDLLPKSWRSI